jgi:hypothetical protein
MVAEFLIARDALNSPGKSGAHQWYNHSNACKFAILRCCIYALTSMPLFPIIISSNGNLKFNSQVLCLSLCSSSNGSPLAIQPLHKARALVDVLRSQYNGGITWLIVIVISIIIRFSVEMSLGLLYTYVLFILLYIRKWWKSSSFPVCCIYQHCVFRLTRINI